MEKNKGCSLGGCLGMAVILLVVFLFLRGCVSSVTGWFSSGYGEPDAFQYTLKRYRNRSLDLRFKLPDDMTFTVLDKAMMRKGSDRVLKFLRRKDTMKAYQRDGFR